MGKRVLRRVEIRSQKLRANFSCGSAEVVGRSYKQSFHRELFGSFGSIAFLSDGDFWVLQVGFGFKIVQRTEQVARNKKCDNRGHSPEGIGGISYPASRQEFLDFIFCDYPEAVVACINRNLVGQSSTQPITGHQAAPDDRSAGLHQIACDEVKVEPRTVLERERSSCSIGSTTDVKR